MAEINKEIGLDAALRHMGVGNGESSPDRSDDEKKGGEVERIDHE